jgi:transposase-like protein
VDSQGRTIDFNLSHTRNAKAAKRFLQKPFKGLKYWQQPTKINTDQNPAYGVAIRKIKDEGKCNEELVHGKRKYLNNVMEADGAAQVMENSNVWSNLHQALNR